MMEQERIVEEFQITFPSVPYNQTPGKYNTSINRAFPKDPEPGKNYYLKVISAVISNEQKLQDNQEYILKVKTVKTGSYVDHTFSISGSYDPDLFNKELIKVLYNNGWVNPKFGSTTDYPELATIHYPITTTFDKGNGKFVALTTIFDYSDDPTTPEYLEVLLEIPTTSSLNTQFGIFGVTNTIIPEGFYTSNYVINVSYPSIVDAFYLQTDFIESNYIINNNSRSVAYSNNFSKLRYLDSQDLIKTSADTKSTLIIDPTQNFVEFEIINANGDVFTHYEPATFKFQIIEK